MESLIEVKQLPVSPLQFQAIRARGTLRLEEARSLICTPESLASVKTNRAETQKEYDALEEWRKALKSWAMEEYKRFEADYKDASKGYVDALSLYSKEIQETEVSIKQDCEDGLRAYFDELCAVHHLDWLVYERAGIKVNMASAKAKTPKKLRDRLAAFVAGVSESVGRISLLDDAEEIMVEFQRSLDAAGAICAVQDRHRRIEEQQAAQEARKAEREREAEMVRRVEALAPPVAVPAPAPAPEKSLDDIIPVCSFTVYDAPRRVLRQIKEIVNMECIRYE